MDAVNDTAQFGWLEWPVAVGWGGAAMKICFTVGSDTHKDVPPPLMIAGLPFSGQSHSMSENPNIVIDKVEYLKTTKPYSTVTTVGAQSAACWLVRLSAVAGHTHQGSLTFSVTCPAPSDVGSTVIWYEAWRSFGFAGGPSFLTYDEVTSDLGQEWWYEHASGWWPLAPGEIRVVQQPNPMSFNAKADAENFLEVFLSHWRRFPEPYGIVGPFSVPVTTHPSRRMSVNVATFKDKALNTQVDVYNDARRTAASESGTVPSAGIETITIDLKTLKITGSFAGTIWKKDTLAPPPV